jgi:hypothetical protein
LFVLPPPFGACFLLCLFGRPFFLEPRPGPVCPLVLGGLGGASLGAALVLAIAVSFPIQRSPFDPNQLYYPPRDLPPLVQGAVLRSWTMGVGRDVLLFPQMRPE